MLKKSLSVTAIIVLIILSTATYFLAGATEQAFYRQVTELNQLAPGQFKFTVQSYDRKFFSAHARTLFSWGDRHSLQVDHQIRHFLWGVEIRSTFSLPDDMSDLDISPPLEELSLISRIAPDGSIRSRLETDQISLNTEQGILDLSAPQLTINQNQALTEADILYNIQSLDFTNGEEKRFSAMSIDGNISLENLQDKPTGSHRIRIQQLQLALPDGPLKATELFFSGETTLNDQLFDISSQASFGKLAVAEEIFTAGGVELQLSGLNWKIIQQSRTFLASWLGSQHASDQETTSWHFQFFPLVLEMLAADIRIDLKALTLANKEGRFTGHGYWIPNSGGSVNTPAFSMFGNSEAQLVFEVDKGLFQTGYHLWHRLQNHSTASEEEMDAIIQLLEEQLVRQRILAAEKDRYLFNFSWADGQGQLNGRTLSWN